MFEPTLAANLSVKSIFDWEIYLLSKSNVELEFRFFGLLGQMKSLHTCVINKICLSTNLLWRTKQSRLVREEFKLKYVRSWIHLSAIIIQFRFFYIDSVDSTHENLYMQPYYDFNMKWLKAHFPRATILIVNDFLRINTIFNDHYCIYTGKVVNDQDRGS